MRFDRRLMAMLVGAGGLAGATVGLRSLMRVADDAPAAELRLPLLLIGVGSLVALRAWRGWRQEADEEADERAAIALADGRFHAYANSGAQVVIAVLFFVLSIGIAMFDGMPVLYRMLAGAAAVLIALWALFDIRERDGSAGRTLSIGADGFEHHWYGLVPWDDIFGIGSKVVVTRTRGKYGTQEIRITWLVLGVVDPFRWQNRIPSWDRTMNRLDDEPMGGRFGDLMVPVHGLDQTLGRIRAVATSHKRRTGRPLLPGWRPEMDEAEIAALIARHRAAGTFPP